MLPMNKFNKTLQQAITASYTLIGAIFFCGLIGYYLSNRYENSLWLFGGLLIGAMVGLYELYKQIKK